MRNVSRARDAAAAMADPGHEEDGPDRAHAVHPCIHGFARYRSHASGNIVTTGPSTSPRAATRSAATTFVPAEIERWVLALQA